MGQRALRWRLWHRVRNLARLSATHVWIAQRWRQDTLGLGVPILRQRVHLRGELQLGAGLLQVLQVGQVCVERRILQGSLFTLGWNNQIVSL